MWRSRRPSGWSNCFELTRSTAADLAEIVYPDLTGTPRSLADPAFAGKARIVEVLGSWCPNCNDSASFLAELDRTYGDRGLSILGLTTNTPTLIQVNNRISFLYFRHL